MAKTDRTVTLTRKEVRALSKASEVLYDQPAAIEDFGIDAYAFDCAIAKVEGKPLPDKSDYEDDE